ncbi:PepSY-associated TM helix domain-containing protein [Sporomusa aerivorans]|uniref:PepSY-associated TM helix domain-containing protein n=1 Tax=Sporomusa aerivorans TaxID=204936 RepID=UPI00352B90BB
MDKAKPNRSFTLAMSELHTWGGLVFGWLLFIIFLTGTLAVFEPEITHWMQPNVRSSQAEPLQAAAAADKSLRLFAPRADLWMIAMPQNRHPDLTIIWKKDTVTLEKQINPQTGRVIKAPETEGGEFFARFHYDLHSGKSGMWLVSLASVVMLAALVSGVAIRRQVFKDFFRLRWRRNWLDVHSMTGVLTLPFVILITYTGLTITFFLLSTAVPQILYGSAWKGPAAVASTNFERPRSNQPGKLLPLTELLPKAEAELGKNSIAYVRVTNPGDRQAVVTFFRTVDGEVVAMSAKASFDGVTGELLGSQATWNKYVTAYRTLVGLHIGRFGGYPVCWLYFAAGLISSAMIATGLIFFTVKRRRRYARSNQLTYVMYRTAEALNITVIMGSVIACITYLWANRLLPQAMTNRSEGEITVFFSVWLIMLLHALLRPPERAWSEQTGFAALLCLGLPLINALTTKVGLAPAIAARDWMTAGIDLTALLLGVVLAVTARRLAARPPAKTDRQIEISLPR